MEQIRTYFNKPNQELLVMSKLTHETKNPLIHDEFLGEPVLVGWDEVAGSAVIFSRSVDGQTLTFARDDDGNLVRRVQQNCATGHDCLGHYYF